MLVNVAGGDTEHGAFENTGDEVWLAMTQFNLLGAVRCCRAAIPHLRRSSKGPAIVNISSVNALAALGSEPYSSAKAGLISLTANLAVSLGPEGIRVNGVAQGTIRTRVWDDQEGGADRLVKFYPFGRVGEPHDVAGAVASWPHMLLPGSRVTHCPSTQDSWPAIERTQPHDTAPAPSLVRIIPA